MLPRPPDLAVIAPTYETRELFAIVKHGLKLTGMPAWPAQHRDDEVWAMAAFLRVLPELDRETYRELSRGETAPATGDAIGGGVPGRAGQVDVVAVGASRQAIDVSGVQVEQEQTDRAVVVALLEPGEEDALAVRSEGRVLVACAGRRVGQANRPIRACRRRRRRGRRAGKQEATKYGQDRDAASEHWWHLRRCERRAIP